MTDWITSLFVEMSTCQCEILKKFSLFVRETTSSQTPNFRSYVSVILQAKKRSEIHVAQVTLLVHTIFFFRFCAGWFNKDTLFYSIFYTGGVCWQEACHVWSQLPHSLQERHKKPVWLCLHLAIYRRCILDRQHPDPEDPPRSTSGH